jgi:hypothetical protein
MSTCLTYARQYVQFTEPICIQKCNYEMMYSHIKEHYEYFCAEACQLIW